MIPTRSSCPASFAKHVLLSPSRFVPPEQRLGGRQRLSQVILKSPTKDISSSAKLFLVKTTLQERFEQTTMSSYHRLGKFRCSTFPRCGPIQLSHSLSRRRTLF